MRGKAVMTEALGGLIGNIKKEENESEKKMMSLQLVVSKGKKHCLSGR